MYKIAGRILDQNDDTSNVYGFSIDQIPQELLTDENIKEAAEYEPQEYALWLLDNGKIHKKFPTDTPIDTYISAWYFAKTAHELPRDIAVKVASFIVKRYVEQDIPITDAVEPTFLLAENDFENSQPVKVAMSAIDQPTMKQERLQKLAELQRTIKQAAKLTPEQRESLPDSVFGLVKKVNGRKIRKYPMHDENHVRAAITFFSMHHRKMSPEDRAQVARKIKQKAREYGIELSEDNPVLKYASEHEKAALQLVYKYASERVGSGIFSHLLTRMRLASPSFRAKYAEFYDAITQLPDLDPLDAAKVLDEIDEAAGLKGKVVSAYEAVYDEIGYGNQKFAELTASKLLQHAVPEAKDLDPEQQKKLAQFLELDEKAILDLLDD